jgi:diacylglycerol kinase family enzyme
VKRVLLVVNPQASSVTPAKTRAVQAELERAGELRTVETEAAGHATELVRDPDADAIVVFGGDGVYNEALNGIDSRPVGFVPGGGTSVLPRALGIPRDPRKAAAQIAEAIVEERTRRISLGRVNGRRFSFSAGIGFDAEAVRRLDSLGRDEDGARPGDLTFAVTLARMLAERRARWAPTLEIDGLGRAAFAFVANGDPYTYAGPVGIHVAPEAQFELGLDLVAPTELRATSVLRFVRFAFTGRRLPGGVLTGHDLDRIVVRCDRPQPLQVDGEDLGDVTEGIFEAERDAVSVLV